MKVNIDLINKAIEGKTFQEVKEYMESNEIEVKQNDNLYMLNVNRRKEIEGMDSLTEFERQCNGIIIEKDTNTVVAMNKNKMYNIDHLDQFETNLYEFCEDGTVVRLYYHNNIWHTATSRCIDAKRSYFWSSQQSYDDMFWGLFPVELLETLDKTFTYVFIILHKDNTFVVKHKENNLLFLTSISNQTFIENRVFNQISDIPSIKQYEKINYEQYRQYEKNGCDDKRGLIVHKYDKDTDTWKMYKKDFDSFKMKQAIRGNTRDIKMRILEIIRYNDKKMLEQFIEFYPEHKFTTLMVVHSIAKLSKNIYYLYVNSHILQKVQIHEDNDYYRVLKQLHAQYKTTKKPITLKDVENKLNSYHPYILKGYLNWV